MCLIVASPEGKIPTSEQVMNAQDHNPDGFGAVYVEDGKLKTLFVMRKYEDLDKAFETLKGKPYVAHFRWATHGAIDRDNAHPFKVVNGRLYVAHNGVIHEGWKLTDKTKSDTWHFVEQVLKPRGMHCIAPKTLTKLGNKIGKQNKLAFLDHTGTISLVNGEQGSWLQGIWYSNLYRIQQNWTSTWTFGTKTTTKSYPSPHVKEEPGYLSSLDYLEPMEFDEPVECEACNQTTTTLTLIDNVYCCDDCIKTIEVEGWQDEDETLISGEVISVEDAEAISRIIHKHSIN